MGVPRLTSLTGPIPPPCITPRTGGPDLLYTEFGYLRRLSSQTSSPAPGRRCPSCGVVTHYIRLDMPMRYESGAAHDAGCPMPAPNFPGLTAGDYAWEDKYLETVLEKQSQLEEAEAEEPDQTEDEVLEDLEERGWR